MKLPETSIFDKLQPPLSPSSHGDGEVKDA